MSEVVESVADKRPDTKRTDGVLAGYVHERELEAQLDLRPRTLQRQRRVGQAPPHIKWGRDVFYRIEAVRAWLLAQERQPRKRRG